MTSIKFSNTSTDFYFASSISKLKEIIDIKNAVFITDENVFNAHSKRFKNYNTIVLKAGEKYKVQQTVDSIIDQLIESGADRKTILVGIGGGVITDITGYAASVFLRGIKFGFIPTTILGLVDASIGGKNGIDVGVYKNMIGTIKQPSFILHDISFLKSLPEEEWHNGFAEIIKHACIKDAAMFAELEQNSFEKYRRSKKLLSNLIQRNALLKCKVVQQDEFETGDRKLLNFGHTLGHAIENTLQIKHGHAVSIGIAAAAKISKQIFGFKDAEKVTALLQKYYLPITAKFNTDKTLEIMLSDKKNFGGSIHYVLLKKIGKAAIHALQIDEVKDLLIGN